MNVSQIISTIRQAEFFQFNESLYKYYLQDLFSKGLLFDDGINRWDIRPFELLEITEFGMQFLKFIEDSDDIKEAT